MTRAPDPATIAPHVDKEWVEDFVVELRVQGIHGTRIGDALAEVEAHCVDAGETVAEAFGPATEYASALGLEPDPHGESDVRRVGWGAGLQILGLFLIPGAVASLLDGERTRAVEGVLVTAALTLGVVAVVALRSSQVMRLVVERPWRAGLLLWLTSTAVVLPGALWRTTLLTVPSAAVVGVGLVAMIVGVLVEARAVTTSDAVVDPTVPQPERSTAWMPILLVPVGTCLLTVLAVSFT